MNALPITPPANAATGIDAKSPPDRGQIRRRHIAFALVVLFLIPVTGCGSRHGSAAAAVRAVPVRRPMIPARALAKTSAMSPVIACAATTEPVQTYDNAIAGIRFCYPAAWKTEKGKTAVLEITAPEQPRAGRACLCLDIPKLPWHIPDMIPIAAVAHDYVSDLRKNQIPDASVQEEVALNVPNAKCRRIISTGHKDGRPSMDIAVIMTHGDHIYILSADSDDTDRKAARHAIDMAVASLQWTK